jgi:hypothetical protein
MPHPSVPRRDDEGACKQDKEHPSITSTGPRLGGSTHGYTSWQCTRRKRMPNTCAGHRRGRLKYCRYRPKQTPRTLADCEKTLQEHPRSCKASGATPTGALARPHGIAQHPGGKNICDNPPRKIPYYRLEPIHFGH